MLCMPPGWWHTTRARSESVALVLSIVNEHNWRPFRSHVMISALKKHKWYKAPAGAALYGGVITAYGWTKLLRRRLTERAQASLSAHSPI